MADTDKAEGAVLRSLDHDKVYVISAPSSNAKGKQRAVSQDGDYYTSGAAQGAVPVESASIGRDDRSSQLGTVITPSMPVHSSKSSTPPRTRRVSPLQTSTIQQVPSTQPIEYDIRPAAVSIAPSASLHALITSSISRSSSSSLSSGIVERSLNDFDIGRQVTPPAIPRKRRRTSSSSFASDKLGEASRSNEGGRHIPLAIRAGLRNEQFSNTPGKGVVDLTEEASPEVEQVPTPAHNRPMSRVEGHSTSTAILIADSPTPPLRPIASPLARSAAAAKARSPEQPESTGPRTLFGSLTCPVCLGPPVPLVLTECGHAFCGPCLHSSLINQTMTPQLLQAIPSITGKELEGTCPVCRHNLLGGWGKSLRGAVLRMQEVEVET